MAAPQQKELSGWKEIASNLGVGVRTAQDYEKNLGLPVHRQPGEKGRVYADPDELDVWRKQTSGNGVPVRKREAVVEPPPVFIRKIWPRGFLIAAVVAVPVLALGAYLLLMPHGPPSDFRVEGKHLIVVNDRGKELWRHTFGVAPTDEAYLPDNKRRLGWLGDLDGRGRPVLLFVYRPLNEAEVGSTILCFAADGKIKWRFTPGGPVTDAGGKRMVHPI